MWIGIAVAGVVFVWVFVGLAALDLLPRDVTKHFDEPEERWAWVIRLIAGVAGLLDLLVFDGEMPYHDFTVELVMASITVLFLDELNQLRSKAEYKRSIIRQMASLSNDFALDAVRIARDEGWLKDGSCKGAHLREANLQGVDLAIANLQEAVLWDTNLQGAVLLGANLQGADLRFADLQGAEYSKYTIWPDGFDPEAAGAILF